MKVARVSTKTSFRVVTMGNFPSPLICILALLSPFFLGGMRPVYLIIFYELVWSYPSNPKLVWATSPLPLLAHARTLLIT